jgi:hypothetical protein
LGFLVLPVVCLLGRIARTRGRGGPVHLSGGEQYGFEFPKCYVQPDERGCHVQWRSSEPTHFERDSDVWQHERPGLHERQHPNLCNNYERASHERNDDRRGVDQRNHDECYWLER